MLGNTNIPLKSQKFCDGMISPLDGSEWEPFRQFGGSRARRGWIRGYMLYDTYQVHSDVLAPIRLMAEFFRGVLTQPWPLIENAPLVRSAAAAMELLSNAGMSHDRPEFGIRKVLVAGEEVGVTEEVVASHPFCKLLHFRKEI